MPSTSAEKLRAKTARYQARKLAEGNELGSIPPVANQDDRDRCDASLLFYLTRCYPGSTGLKPFSSEQITAIEMLEHSLRTGSRCVLAFPRGFAKTAITLRAALWAVKTGLRKMVTVYCANEVASSNLVRSGKTELLGNAELLELYPECAYPIVHTGGIGRRGENQTFDGVKTNLVFNAEMIRLADVGNVGAGGVVMAKSITSSRGLQETIVVDGRTEILRPDFIILDDVQKSDDAASEHITGKLIKKIKKDILRGGGHSRSLAAANLCTVIEKYDTADTFLEDPSWSAMRIPMMKALPANRDIWDEYKQIRNGFDKAVPGAQTKARLLALQFYKNNRSKMDEGAVPTWDWCYEWDDEPQTEISATQHAMNILLDEGEEVFQCECQNDPPDDGESNKLITVEFIVSKQHAQERHIVPRDAEKLVMYVDVQQDLLFATVGAFTMDFNGYLIDRLSYPEMGRRLWTKRDLPRRISTMAAYKDCSTHDVWLYHAMTDFLSSALETTYKREGDSSLVGFDVIGVDSGFEQQVVFDVINDLKAGQKIIPCKGYGSGKTKAPLAFRKPKKGERKGAGYFYSLAEKDKPRVLDIDTNERKSFLLKRMLTPLKQAGSFSLYKADATHHELIAQHCLAEYPSEIETQYGDFWKWEAKHGHPDNDYWDCLVGLSALASFQGCEFIGSKSKPKKSKTFNRSRYLESLEKQ